LGGELNAYTAKEETVIYATVLREDLPKALDLIMEIAFTSTFDAVQLAKEKSVVADEINMCKDTPSDQIFDDFEEYLFSGHPLSRNILGTTASLKKITPEHIKDYVRRYFRPENMNVSVVGDFDARAVERMMERVINRYSPYFPKCEAGRFDICSPSISVFRKDVCKKNHQANCIIGCSGYPVGDSRRIALALLVNVLGGPASNSRLNSLLRERKALVYNIECSYVQYSTSGVVTIYFGSDKANVDKCIALVMKELRRIRDIKMSPRALAAAKKQLLASLAVASDNGEAQALAMAKNLLAFGKCQSEETIRTKVGEITAEQLQETACDIFAPEKLSILIYR
ncbi:MAG: insulinase family protein, partial [Bacteroidales bacterium]|nr:insulinase family protein [Bacteroidales bacterium]